MATAVVVIVTAGGSLVINSWRSTHHGKLDWRVAIYMKLASGAENSLGNANLSVSESRRILAARSASVAGSPVKLASVKDMKAAVDGYEVPVRVYTPYGNAPLPALMFYHGGGWVQGGIATHDNLCRILAAKSGAVVISVEYRLAPENPFPAGVNDAYGALKWAHSSAELLNIEPRKIAVAGDSAGGNLAAVVCLMSRDKKWPPVIFQALIYPGLNSAHLNTESYKNFASGYLLEKSAVERLINMYLPEGRDRAHPYVSPLLAADHSALPAALIISAGFDVLRDEGTAYVLKLKNAGVAARQIVYPGMIHGFISADRFLPQAGQATDEIAAALKAAYSAD